MIQLSVLLFSILYLPADAFAHQGQIAWTQFASSADFEWTEVSLVVTAFIFYLLSNYFKSFKGMTSRSKKQYQNNK